MKYNDNAQLDPSQMGGGGGGGNGGKIAIGGGAGLVIAVIALLLGINPGDILGSDTTTQTSSTTQSTPYAACTRGSDIAKNRSCRFVAYTNSIQAYWGGLKGYQKIQVKTFTGAINTACGNATSAVGPFYCPGDTTVYLDTGFFDELTGKLGATGGDAAEAYVIAHEFGHHIQNLTGTMRKVQGSGGQQTGATSNSVRLELQADCYAGVWFNHATSDPSSPIAEVTQADLADAVNAAQAVGDDRIQQKTQGQVTPETWTHGSSAERQKWLTTGFTTGNPSSCNTFASGAVT